MRAISSAVTIILVMLVGGSIVSAAETKRVLLLHSFGPDVKPWSDYATAIRAELKLRSQWPLEIYEHSLVTARSSDENPEVPFVTYLGALFAKRQPDLIVSIGAPAAAFVQRQRQQLFPTTPMLLTVVDQRRVQYSVLTANDAVVAVSIDYARALENILRVLPETKQVALVVGSSPIEKYWLEEILNEWKPFAERITIIPYNNLSFEDILKHAAALPAHSAIFWELMVVDAAGVPHEEGTALTRLYAAANAPIFSYTDAFFGREIVGGPHVPVDETGRRTAEVANRILGGEKPADIKVPPVGFATPKYDWREMQRWGISKSRLPPGSEIYFRTPTVWEQYRPQILATFAAVLLQAALISWLLYEHRQRRRSEAEAHELSGKLITTQEEERARLARELHDDITQRLALLAIDAGRESQRPASAGNSAAIRAMRDNLVRLSEDVHALSYRLHPSIVEDLGLVEAMRSECDRFSRTCPTRLEAELEEAINPVPRDAALSLFRIAQEALRNVGRHAKATRATVSLRRLNGGLELAVTDNGAGFDPGRDRKRTSLGHASMRQRAFLLGGKVEVVSSPGGGTTIRAWIPLKEEDAEPFARASG